MSQIARMMEERYWQARLRVLDAMTRCRDARAAWRESLFDDEAYEDLQSAEAELAFRVDVADRSGYAYTCLQPVRDGIARPIPMGWLLYNECAA